MNLFRISFTNQYQEFDFYYITDDGYIGDHKLRKLVIEKEWGVKFGKDLWKEFKANNPDYMAQYEIIDVELIKDVVLKPPKP